MIHRESLSQKTEINKELFNPFFHSTPNFSKLIGNSRGQIILCLTAAPIYQYFCIQLKVSFRNAVTEKFSLENKTEGLKTYNSLNTIKIVKIFKKK